jgi:hypothetical protein
VRKFTVLTTVGVAAAMVAALAVYWRRFPRAGLRWTNDVLNPWLVEHGWSGSGGSEIGTLEHFGRRTGTRHLTPIHAVRTYEGFRIVVPLAERSEWALNVLAAGRCRLQLHDTVYDLDHPVFVQPVDVRDLPATVRWAEARLGFKYLRLHRSAEHPGALEPTEAVIAPPAPVEVPARPDREAVGTT